MSAALLKRQFESELGGHLDWQSRPSIETVSTGIAEIDRTLGGLPRGCLTEIVGPVSSGRTSLLTSMLAAATARQETCALVDTDDAFIRPRPKRRGWICRACCGSAAGMTRRRRLK